MEEDIIKLDPNFSEAKFKTKVDNIFVKLHIGIMKKNIEDVRHFISDNIYEKYSNYIKGLASKNYTQMYDELNVASTDIQNTEIKDGKIIIKVCIKSRYMDYILDMNTRRVVSGVNTRRVEKLNYLTFEKKIGALSQENARKCPACGANIDVNNIGKCAYCGTIYNLQDYDYILTDIRN